MMIEKLSFGSFAEKEVFLFKLHNPNGMRIDVMSFGGVIVALYAPDRNGQLDDVVLGFATLDGYTARPSSFGCIVGRYANRISNARFTIDGEEFMLTANRGQHHIHGGNTGFNRVVWDAKVIEHDGAAGVELSYLSVDGEEGYPGNLSCTVTYLLTDDNELKIKYVAKTDKPTHINFTNHSYFNLAGHGNGSIENHELMIMAKQFTEADENLIPTGKILAVAGTPFDFRSPRRIGEGINSDDQQIQLGRGYDHNFVLDSQSGALALAARVSDPASGRVMETWTTEPGLQFYSFNSRGSVTGKGGRVYGPRSGLCLETQHFPDSPNQPNFPTTLLRPGETFSSETVYKFSVE